MSRDCPRRDDLERALQSADTLNSDLDRHVQSCGVCAERVREVGAAADDLFEELRLAIPASATDLPTIAGYELREEIHRGGQGIVYAALQLGTQRLVAIKLLRGDALATDIQRRRFDREIELIASLDHENIVTVFESGRTATGQPYLAMEYVEGTTLHHHLARQNRSAEEVVALFVAICAGVSYAHQRGVIHRDLKPSNVLVDQNGTPRIVDFGLAVEVDPQGSSGGPLTADGVFVGTLAYASPEQVSKSHADVDPRTDVYALGIMLYEAIAGRPPYALTGGLREVVHTITGQDPAPFPEGTDGELEVIVRTALAKDVDRRYQTAGALGRDLGHYLRGEALDAHPATALYRLRKTVRRYKRGVIAASVLLVVMLAAAVGMAIQWRNAENARAATTTAVDFLRLTLFSPFHGGEPGPDHRLVDALKWGSPQVIERFAADPHTELRLHEDFARVFRQFGEPDAALHHARRGHELTIELYGSDSAEAGDSAHRLAILLYTRALARHRGIAWHRRLGKGKDAPRTALVGLSETNAADLADAVELEEHALRVRRDHDPEAAETSAERLAAMRRALGRDR